MLPPSPHADKWSHGTQGGGGWEGEKNTYIVCFLCSQLTFLIILPSCFPPLTPLPPQTHTQNISWNLIILMKRKHHMNVFCFFHHIWFCCGCMCVSMFANIFFWFCFGALLKAYDYPVICHQTVSLQLFELRWCDFCCLLIITNLSTVHWMAFFSGKTRKP